MIVQSCEARCHKPALFNLAKCNSFCSVDKAATKRRFHLWLFIVLMSSFSGDRLFFSYALAQEPIGAHLKKLWVQDDDRHYIPATDQPSLSYFAPHRAYLTKPRYRQIPEQELAISVLTEAFCNDESLDSIIIIPAPMLLDGSGGTATAPLKFDPLVFNTQSCMCEPSVWYGVQVNHVNGLSGNEQLVDTKFEDRQCICHPNTIYCCPNHMEDFRGLVEPELLISTGLEPDFDLACDHFRINYFRQIPIGVYDNSTHFIRSVRIEQSDPIESTTTPNGLSVLLIDPDNPAVKPLKYLPLADVIPTLILSCQSDNQFAIVPINTNFQSTNILDGHGTLSAEKNYTLISLTPFIQIVEDHYDGCRLISTIKELLPGDEEPGEPATTEPYSPNTVASTTEEDRSDPTLHTTPSCDSSLPVICSNRFSIGLTAGAGAGTFSVATTLTFLTVLSTTLVHHYFMCKQSQQNININIEMNTQVMTN